MSCHLSDEIRIQRGVIQVCIVSPTFFNEYTEHNLKTTTIKMNGVNVGGTNHNHLRHADDTALLAGNGQELSPLIGKMNEVGKQFGIKINIEKTNGCQQGTKSTQSKYYHRWITY